MIMRVINASRERVKPRSVNIALETVLAFDNKNNAADVKFIDDVQSFLSKVRNVVDKNKRKPARRHFNSNVYSMRFTAFVIELIELLKTYDNDDLEDIFAVIDDEIRKYHYKGCKFYELVEDPNLRRFVANKLNLVKEKPAKDIRWKLDGTLQVLEDAKFDSKQTDVIDYVNSLFTKDDGLQFKRILDILQTYRSKSKRANLDLVKLVRDSIRTVIFDKYSSLSPNTRRDFKMKLEAFWMHLNQLEKYNDKIWTESVGKQNNEFNEKSYKPTPVNLKEEFKDVFFLKELVTMTPFIHVEKDGTEKKIIIFENDKNEIARNNKDDSNISSDTKGRDILSEQSDSRNNNDLDLGKSLSSENENSDVVYQSVSRDIKRQIKFDQDCSSSREDDQDDSSDSSVMEVTKRRKHHHKRTKATTPMFESDEFVRPEKMRYPSLLTGYSGKSKKNHKNLNMASFVTLYPETITTKRKRFKIESTTKISNIRMQTLWQEKFKHKQNHRNRHKQDSSISSDDMDKEIYVGTEIPESRIRPQKNKDNFNQIRHRHKKGKTVNSKKNIYNFLEPHHNAKHENNMNMQNNKGGKHMKSIDSEISSKFTPQKNTRQHSSHKNHKQHGNMANHAKEKLSSEKLIDKSTDEESVVLKSHKHVDTSKEEVLFTEHKSFLNPKAPIEENVLDRELSSAGFKDNSVEKSMEVELDSAYKKHKILAEITEEELDSTSKAFKEFTDDKLDTYHETHQTTEESTESESDSQGSQTTEKELDFLILQDKSHKKEINNTSHKNETLKEDSLVDYTITTPEMKIETADEITSPRPKHKILQSHKKSYTYNYPRHKMVDRSSEIGLATPNSKHANKQKVQKDLPIHDSYKMAEKSTEYEAEEIIRSKLYKKNTTKARRDNIQKLKLSEEGIGIESYESNFSKSFRKSNDIDNFSTTKGSLMKRIDFNYKPEVVKNKAETQDSNADKDFLSVQKKRYPTLPYWEGTTRNTAVTKISSYRTPIKTRQRYPTITKKSNTIPTNTQASTKKVTDKINLLELSTVTKNTIYPTITTSNTITISNNFENITTFDLSKITKPDEIVQNNRIVNLQDYLNRNIANLEISKANANKPRPGIIPFANSIPNTNFAIESLESLLNNGLTTAPPNPSTFQNYSTIFSKDVLNLDRPNGISAHPVGIPLFNAVTITAPTVEDIGQLLKRYGLSSVSPMFSNFIRNNSIARRNIPLDAQEETKDKYKADLETVSDLDIDNLLDNFEIPARNYVQRNERGTQYNTSHQANVTAREALGAKFTRYPNFHDFLTDTTSALFAGVNEKKHKILRKKFKKKRFFEKAINLTDSMEDFDNIGDPFDLL